MDHPNDNLQREDETSASGFSVGFLTALASSELIQCEDELRRSGWVETATKVSLRDAGIKSWQREIDGTLISAFSMAINGMGNATSTLETFNFLYRTKPTLVFLCGIAGSLHESKVFKGDVVVGSSVRWRTRNRITETKDGFIYRPKEMPLSNSTLDADFARVLHNKLIDEYPSKQRTEQQFENWNVHFEEIYTWDYVLDSETITREINQSFPNSFCVEMEAGGFLAAVDKYQKLITGKPIVPLIIRGISDYTSKKDKQTNIRKETSRNAARVAISLAEWLSSEEGFDLIRKEKI